jgi:hypothetical protein
MLVSERSQIRNEKQIEEQLQVGRLFIMTKLRILIQMVMVRFDGIVLIALVRIRIFL